MADSPTSFARYAGVARFPRNDTDLTSTSQCPACFHVLTDVVCTNCQLDLGHPAAAELALVSSDAAGLLDERTELIGRIRFETALQTRQVDAVSAANAAAAPATVHHPASAVVDIPIHVAAPVDVAAPTPPRTPPAAPPAAGASTADAPRRSSVQVGLIVVGVSLVSVAAIFFLVYAFINYGIVWRSVIIAAITVAAFAVASLLRRRGLGSTAEGIAAFSVVLVYLDAFAIRANDLFGAGSSEPLVYWGATLVVSAVVFAVWHRASRLRVGSICAAIAFAPGIGLLVAGLGGELEGGSRVFASLLAVGLAGLVHPFAGARGEVQPAVAAPERAIAVSIGGLGLVAAFFAAFVVTPDTVAGTSIALVALSAAAGAHVAVVVRSTDEKAESDPTLAHTVVAFFAAVAAVSVAVAVVTFAYRALSFGGAMLGSTVVPAALAFVLGYSALRHVAPRSAPTSAGIALRASALGAAAVAALAVVVPIGTVVTLDAAALSDALSLGAWSRQPADAISAGVREAAPAFGAVLLVIAFVALFARITGRSARVRGGLVWATAALLVLAAPLLTTLAATMTGWFALAAVSVVLLIWSARTGALGGYRSAVVAVAVAATSTLLAFAVSWASTGTWLAGTITTIVLLLATRFAVTAAESTGRGSTGRGSTGPEAAAPAAPAPSPDVARAALLAAAVVIALVGAAAAGRQYGVHPDGVYGDGVYGDDRALWVNTLAVGLFALSALPLTRVLSALDRRALFVLGALATVYTAPFAGGGVVTPVVFTLALLGWMLTPRSTSNTVERVISAFALAPALVWILLALDSRIDLSGDATQVGVIGAALIAAAISLAFAVRRAGYDLRKAGDLGVAIVAVAGAAVFAFGPSDVLWLGMLLAAVTALVSAVSPSGLFAAAGRRKHLGWAALALATGSLWWRLSESSVTAVEAYVLPLAAALSAVAALDWRARRGAATPTLAFAAMLVAVVPIALSAAIDEPARAVVVGAVAATVLLVGSVLRAPVWVRPYLDGLAVTGFVSVLILAVGQSAVLATSPLGKSNGRPDVWLAASLVVLVVSALGQCSGRPGDRPGTRVLGQALAISGLVVVAVVETVLLDATTAGFARAVAVVTLFSAVHVGSRLARTPPFTRATGWLSLALGGVTAVVAVAVDAVDAVEWVSVPIAVALLVSGILRMRADPALRSWPAIGAGLLVLLVPSLVESQNDSPVWRLVAIGVVSVAVLVVGVVRRLQAPFIVGGVVALVHGFATFAPQLLDVYQATEWWVWIGIGGAIIIVLGARYERSIATAKNVIANIAGLR